MLIGKLLEPWEVVNCHGDGPYAIRTLLGWVINSSIGSCQIKCDPFWQNESECARVNFELQTKKVENVNFGQISGFHKN